MGAILSLLCCKSETKPKAPHNYEAILRNVESPLSPDTTSSLEKLYPLLFNGVFLKDKKQKYWVESEGKKNCFMLYARDLNILRAETHSNDFWTWLSLDQSPSEAGIEVAKTETIKWLEVTGRFEVENLTPESLYEVVFIVKLEDPIQGWEKPVTFKLILPTGETKEHQENMSLLEKDHWVDIPAGEFKTSASMSSGEIEFSMSELTSGEWKTGLVVKGVTIRPKN